MRQPAPGEVTALCILHRWRLPIAWCHHCWLLSCPSLSITGFLTPPVRVLYLLRENTAADLQVSNLVLPQSPLLPSRLGPSTLTEEKGPQGLPSSIHWRQDPPAHFASLPHAAHRAAVRLEGTRLPRTPSHPPGPPYPLSSALLPRRYPQPPPLPGFVAAGAGRGRAEPPPGASRAQQRPQPRFPVRGR